MGRRPSPGLGAGGRTALTLGACRPTSSAWATEMALLARTLP
jgi:hypothetical protein